MGSERSCTVLESLKQSLREMQMMREGKIPKRNWKDFCKSVKEDMNKDKNCKNNS